MKKLTLKILFSCFVCSTAFGLHQSEKTLLFHHLRDVNKEWNLRDAENYSEVVSFESDIERIEKHLLLVEKNLRAISIFHLSKQSKLNRLSMLDVLHDYAMSKNFPINTGHKIRQPYFIDNYGTYCAVGFLVKESGFDYISKLIAEKQNFAFVREINSPDLLKWSEDFGFTIEELAWIQPMYSPTQSYTQIGEGANGQVSKSVTFGSKWFFGGEFDSLNNLPCLKMGVYENGQLSCLGNGLDGEINDMDYDVSTGLKVSGHFQNGSTLYPLANYLSGLWSFDSIPTRPNARSTASFAASNYFYTVIDDPIEQGNQELWKLSNEVWELVAIIHGTINEIGTYGSLYGDFDSVKVFLDNSWENYNSKNVLLRNYSGECQTIIGLVPDIIYAFEKIGSTIYVGGSAGLAANSSGSLVSSVLNGVAQPMLTVADLGLSINYDVFDMKKRDNSSFYIVGNFKGSLNSFYDMNNIGLVQTGLSSVVSFGYFDQTIHTLGTIGNSFCVGGEFSKNSLGGMNATPYIQYLNRLAKFEGYLSIDEINSGTFDLSLYPNPSKGELNIQANQIEKVEILNAVGSLVHEENKNIIDLSHLPNGIYFVRVFDQHGNSAKAKWIKN